MPEDLNQEIVEFNSMYYIKQRLAKKKFGTVLNNPW